MKPVISGQPSAPCRAGEKARPRRWDSAAPGLAGVMLLFSLARPMFRGLLVPADVDQTAEQSRPQPEVPTSTTSSSFLIDLVINSETRNEQVQIHKGSFCLTHLLWAELCPLKARVLKPDPPGLHKVR